MVTLKDVAREAGVSPSTVSRVLGGKALIARKTRDKVQATAKRLGYRPNRLAQGLVNRKSTTIGMLVPDITNPHFAQVARGVESLAREMDHTVILCNTDDLGDRENDYVRMLLAQQVAGVVLAGDAAQASTTGEDCVEALRAAGCAVLLANRRPSPGLHAALVNNEQAMYDATAHLARLGRRRISYLLGAADLWASQQRLSGYRRALADFGLAQEAALIETGFFYREGGAQAFGRLMDANPNLDAVVCENDLMAVGALQEAKRRGLSVPDDVAVVGWGDTYLCEVVDPPLSSVGYDAYEFGRGAGRLLLEIVKRNQSPFTLLYESTLKVRASSGTEGV